MVGSTIYEAHSTKCNIVHANLKLHRTWLSWLLFALHHPSKSIPCGRNNFVFLSLPQTAESSPVNDKNDRHGCPYDKDDLGRSTWGFLHTMAANYPEVPSKEEITNMSTFFSIFAKVYPCDMCAKDFQKE